MQGEDYEMVRDVLKVCKQLFRHYLAEAVWEVFFGTGLREGFARQKQRAAPVNPSPTPREVFAQ